MAMLNPLCTKCTLSLNGHWTVLLMDGSEYIYIANGGAYNYKLKYHRFILLTPCYSYRVL